MLLLVGVSTDNLSTPCRSEFINALKLLGEEYHPLFCLNKTSIGHTTKFRMSKLARNHHSKNVHMKLS